jgi:uncharacterized surface protein with fasciclin (FAS1) repeats
MGMKLSLIVPAAVLALAIAGCGQKDGNANQANTGQSSEAQKQAGGETIAAGLDQNGKFFQAAKAVGLDGTLGGPGPYTVLVPNDAVFAKVEGALKDPANPQDRAELTRILTYHILPGTVLAEDLGTAVDNGKGKAMIGTMGGETLTATKEGGKIVLTDGAGTKATVTEADQKRSNGVVHMIDAVLTPSAAPTAPKQ